MPIPMVPFKDIQENNTHYRLAQFIKKMRVLHSKKKKEVKIVNKTVRVTRSNTF